MTEVTKAIAPRIWTFSELSLALQCPAKWRWVYREGIEAVYDGMPRPTGRALHAGVEAICQGAPPEVVTRTADDALVAALESWTPRSDKEEQDLDTATRQVEAMLAGYPALADYDGVVECEVELQVDMGRGRAYGGKIDRLVRQGDRWWVHDVKTTGEQDEKGMRRMIQAQRLRMQYPGYRLLAESTGKQVVGVLLDVVRKPTVYRKRAVGHEGEFSSIGKAAYHREPLVVTPEDVGAFRAWFHGVVDMIEGWEAAGYWPTNDSSCTAWHRLCWAHELCSSPQAVERLVGDGSRFRRRVQLHEELEGV